MKLSLVVAAGVASGLIPVRIDAAFADRARVELSLESHLSGARVAPGRPIPLAVRLTIVGPNRSGLAGFAVDLVPDAANPAQVQFQPGAPPAEMALFVAPAGYSNPSIPGSSVAFGYSGTIGPIENGSPILGLLQVGGVQNVFGVPGTLMGTNAHVDDGVALDAGGMIVSTGSVIAPSLNGHYVVRLRDPAANLLRWRDEPPWASPVYPARTTIAGTGEITFEVVCLADFNRDNSVTLQDLFEYMDAWFAAAPDADVNDDQAVTLQDLFDFLDLWFVGC